MRRIRFRVIGHFITIAAAKHTPALKFPFYLTSGRPFANIEFPIKLNFEKSQ